MTPPQPFSPSLSVNMQDYLVYISVSASSSGMQPHVSRLFGSILSLGCSLCVVFHVLSMFLMVTSGFSGFPPTSQKQDSSCVNLPLGVSESLKVRHDERVSQYKLRISIQHWTISFMNMRIYCSKYIVVQRDCRFWNLCPKISAVLLITGTWTLGSVRLKPYLDWISLS